MTSQASLSLSLSLSVSLSLSLSQKSLTHNIGSASALPIIRLAPCASNSGAFVRLQPVAQQLHPVYRACSEIVHSASDTIESSFPLFQFHLQCDGGNQEDRSAEVECQGRGIAGHA